MIKRQRKWLSLPNPAALATAPFNLEKTVSTSRFTLFQSDEATRAILPVPIQGQIRAKIEDASGGDGMHFREFERNSQCAMTSGERVD
ncbi:MAG: hypothetical protein N2C14_10885 [Planctomycetales bacterium]